MSYTICGRVIDSTGSKEPIVNATVTVHGNLPCDNTSQLGKPQQTDEEGKFEFPNLDEGTHYVSCSAFGVTATQEVKCDQPDKKEWVELCLHLGLAISLHSYKGQGEETEPCSHAVVGRRLLVRAESNTNAKISCYDFTTSSDCTIFQTNCPEDRVFAYSEPGIKPIAVKVLDKTTQGGNTSGAAAIAGGKSSKGGNTGGASATVSVQGYVSDADRQMIGGNIGVRLERTRVFPTRDQALWIAIRNRTHAIGFSRYSNFINKVLQIEEREHLDNPLLERKLSELGTNLHGVGAYEVLKIATEAFLLLECGIRIEDDRDRNQRFFHPEFESARLGEPVSFEYAQSKLREYLGSPPQLPYITRVIAAAFPEWRTGGVSCDRVLTGGINEPCLIELIWSYWHEEGMLAQTMNAITRRFQNVRSPGDRDPIAHLEIDPLRPMNNIIWGVIQDEIRRLSVKRRAYEYEHQYGLSLYGKAIRDMRPADSRSKFLEAFHNLLHLCSIFFKEDNDTTVIADGYPLLNALKEVHLILAQGAHNQFGDMPWTARAEMMLQQYILSRPELRDFLQSRAMVPYKEAWMPQVDTMKTLQGWSDVTVTHFRDLAVYGEQILLSVRYGDWIAINDEDSAKNWARYWRPEIQGYLHAYRAATGIDLTNADTVDATIPAILLQKRLAVQQQRTR
jgi:hypothetical protein